MSDNVSIDQVEEYRYRILTPADAVPDAVDWQTFVTDTANPSVEIDVSGFFDVLSGYAVPVLRFEAVCLDKNGNESEIAADSVIVDTTIPVITGLQFENRYISSENTLYGISFTLDDLLYQNAVFIRIVL